MLRSLLNIKVTTWVGDIRVLVHGINVIFMSLDYNAGYVLIIF